MAAEIDYDRIKYVTNRKLKNSEKEETGHVKMYSYDGETFAYALKCPFCGELSQGEAVFKKRPYNIECSKCGKKARVPRLKGKSG